MGTPELVPTGAPTGMPTATGTISWMLTPQEWIKDVMPIHRSGSVCSADRLKRSPQASGPDSRPTGRPTSSASAAISASQVISAVKRSAGLASPK